MKIAVEGCAHGELDTIYETISHLETENDIKIDLLIICGDFQAVRNLSDLPCMAVPKKYQTLNTFYKYYSGEKTAPLLTIFVGGNHEASNYLSELSYGGWVCPNIYYLGNASVVNIGGLRIAGLSGIYKGQDYLKGHFEMLPYNESTKRSVYHIRNIDVFRLKQIKTTLDICISHDWPRGIYNFGDKDGLLRFKPFFKEDMDNDKLGSRPAEELLNKLCPKYWFAAHLHCKFSAIVPHEKDGKITYTKFLALDKCLPRRRFLQILDMDTPNIVRPVTIKYDPEWLAILSTTNHLVCVNNVTNHMPGPGCLERWDFSASEDEIENIKKLFDGKFEVPDIFTKTAPPHSTATPEATSFPEVHINPQTTVFCKKLGIDDPMALLVRSSPQKTTSKNYSFVEDLNVTNASQSSLNPDEISLQDEFDSDFDENVSASDDTDGLETTASSSFVYINKTPMPVFNKKNSKVSLQERFEMHLTSTPISKTSAEAPLYEFPEIKTLSSPEVLKEEQEPEKKKPIQMKRRNQLLYQTKDEDSD